MGSSIIVNRNAAPSRSAFWSPSVAADRGPSGSTPDSGALLLPCGAPTALRLFREKMSVVSCVRSRFFGCVFLLKKSDGRTAHIDADQCAALVSARTRKGTFGLQGTRTFTGRWRVDQRDTDEPPRRTSVRGVYRSGPRQGCRLCLFGRSAGAPKGLEHQAIQQFPCRVGAAL